MAEEKFASIKISDTREKAAKSNEAKKEFKDDKKDEMVIQCLWKANVG